MPPPLETFNTRTPSIVVFWLTSVQHVGVYTFLRGPLCITLFMGTMGQLGSKGIWILDMVQGATSRKSVELVLFSLLFLLQLCQRFLLFWCLATFGECCESTLGSYRVLRFYQHKIYNYNTCSFVQVDAFIVDM